MSPGHDYWNLENDNFETTVKKKKTFLLPESHGNSTNTWEWVEGIKTSETINHKTLLQRRFHASSVINEFVFIFGGERKYETISPSSSSTTASSRESSSSPVAVSPTTKILLNDILIYDTVNNVWLENVTSTSSKNVPEPRKGHTLLTWNNNLILFGGAGHTKYFNDMWIFDASYIVKGEFKNPLNYYWRKLIYEDKEDNNKSQGTTTTNFLPLPRAYHSAVITNNDLMFIYGGYGYACYLNDAVDLFSDDLWCLDLKNNFVWSQIMPIGIPPLIKPYGHAACTIGDHMLIFGGQSHMGALNDNSIYKFNFATKQWLITSLCQNNNGCAPCPRTYHAATCFGNHWYIHGGSNDEDHIFSDFYEFNIKKNEWYMLTTLTTPLPLEGHIIACAMTSKISLALCCFGHWNTITNNKINDNNNDYDPNKFLRSEIIFSTQMLVKKDSFSSDEKMQHIGENCDDMTTPVTFNSLRYFLMHQHPTMIPFSNDTSCKTRCSTNIPLLYHEDYYIQHQLQEVMILLKYFLQESTNTLLESNKLANSIKCGTHHTTITKTLHETNFLTRLQKTLQELLLLIQEKTIKSTTINKKYHRRDTTTQGEIITPKFDRSFMQNDEFNKKRVRHIEDIITGVVTKESFPLLSPCRSPTLPPPPQQEYFSSRTTTAERDSSDYKLKTLKKSIEDIKNGLIALQDVVNSNDLPLTSIIKLVSLTIPSLLDTSPVFQKDS